MADSCALARERLVKKVASLRQTSRVEKVTTGIKAGFLASVVTPMKALGGNALSLSYRTLAEHPVRAATDYVLALGRSARAGEFSFSPDQYRQVRFALDADGFGKIGKGLKAGSAPLLESLSAARQASRGAKNPWQAVRHAVQKFGEELSARLDADKTGVIPRTLDYQPTTYNSPTVNGLVQSVMGIMEAVDRPYWRVAHDFSMHQQSYVMAAAEGLTGKAMKTRAAEYFANPTDEMVARAHGDANYTTFKNKNFLSRLASGMKQGARNAADAEIPANATGVDRATRETKKAGAKVGSYVLETNLPFTGVPSSIAGQSFSLASGPLSLVRLLTNRDPALTSRIVSDATLGTALIAMGYQLAREGNITGAAPQAGTPERALWDAEGKQAYSVKVGGTWFDSRFAVPVTAPLYAGAALAKAKEEEPDAGPLERVGTAGSATAQMLTQQTYLQNVRALIDAMASPEDKASRLLASQVPIPALVGQVARATDPVERAPDGIAERIKSRIPFLSQTLPPRVDMFGREERRTPLERLTEIASPGRAKVGNETDLTKELRAVGARIPELSKSTTVQGVRTTRAGAEQAALKQEIGPEIEAALRKIIANPDYQKYSNEQKAEWLERAAARIRSVRARQHTVGAR